MIPLHIITILYVYSIRTRSCHRYTVLLLFTYMIVIIYKTYAHGHLRRRLTVRRTYCYPILLGVHTIYYIYACRITKVVKHLHWTGKISLNIHNTHNLDIRIIYTSVVSCVYDNYDAILCTCASLGTRHNPLCEPSGLTSDGFLLNGKSKILFYTIITVYIIIEYSRTTIHCRAYIPTGYPNYIYILYPV